MRLGVRWIIHNIFKHVSFIILGEFLVSCHGFTDAEDGAPKTLRVLWIGTSIPKGCTYPSVSCKNLGLKCINKSISDSYVHFNEAYTHPPFSRHYGLSLSLSSGEKEVLYRKYVDNGTLAGSLLKKWKNASYDKVILPYIKDVDIVVFDHGYNDGDILEEEMVDDDNMDWNSEDRRTFIGSFNYLYHKMISANPSVKVIIGGYFQNKCTMRYLKRGYYLSNILEKIGEHYDLPVLDVWNYVDIPDGYIPNSAGYLEQLNREYGTSYELKFSDEEGNVSYFQKFCPDGVHPFSDPTGTSDHILDEVFTNLLRQILTPL